VHGGDARRSHARRASVASVLAPRDDGAVVAVVVGKAPEERARDLGAEELVPRGGEEPVAEEQHREPR
jgi:hypothetical protein